MRFVNIIFLVLVSLAFIACEKYLPEDRDSLESDASFTISEYQPTLGRRVEIRNNFAALGSTLPLTFKLVNVKRFDGEAADELTQLYPVKIWKGRYTGLETSYEEIENKREIQYRPLFEIGESNGAIMMWPNGNSAFIKHQPDSGYTFDVEVSNSGGRKFFRNLRLKPLKERPYEPNNILSVSGLNLDPFVSPITFNLFGDRTGAYIPSSSIKISFNKIQNAPYGGNTLTLRVLDSIGNSIPLERFNKTNWTKLVHGFNMVKTNEYVRYKVAYPIPLTAIGTEYTTSNGGNALMTLAYERLGFGQILESSSLTIPFAIYEEGDWEVVIIFTKESPRFSPE